MSEVRTAPMIRAITGHATPILVAQLASMSTTVIDTIVAGRIGTLELAAVGIGGGVYISVMLALAGVAQGVTPIAAQHFGAKRHDMLPPTFQQAVWVALMLAILGFILLRFPGWLLSISSMDADLEARTREYLGMLAYSLPGTLVYRVCGGMFNALGRPRLLMVLGLSLAISHAFLSPALAFGWLEGWLGLAPLGALGCALSSAILLSMNALLAMLYLWRSPFGRPFALMSGWQWPRLRPIAEQLRVGVPIGVSAFVEITSFALIALLVAPLGAQQIAAHRVLGSFAGVCYMLPLSISIATLALVAQAAGAGDVRRVRKTVRAGMILGLASSALLGLALWLSGDWLVRAYTPDPAVQTLALSLVALIAFYQLFDAVQTVAAQALRGLKITAGPMTIHIVCFWGVGLAGGWWLCFHGAPQLGIAPVALGGFWWAATIATVIAGAAFAVMMKRRLRGLMTQTPTQ